MRYILSVLVVTAVASGGYITPVMAQADNRDLASEGLVAGDIIVTARRRVETLQTVPVAATAVTSTMLEAKGIDDIQELSMTSPSLTATSVFSSTNANFSLRGFAPDNNNYGGEPVVINYFADIPQIRAPLSQFYDLESVQILRGPQGTLFGRASNGGAILLTPVQPGNELSGHVRTQFGNFNNRELEAAITLPIIDDRLSVRLAGSIVRRDGYTEVLNNPGFKMDNNRSEAFRISVSARPFEGLTNDLVFDYVNVD